jgi:transcriptional regulator with XRE-family HTH domain
MNALININMLKSLRELRGWDYQTLATQAKVDRSVISRIERGSQHDLKVSVLVAIARALEVPVDQLIVASNAAGAGDGDQNQLVAELSVVVSALAPLSPTHQRQVAAILRGYLSILPE